MNRFVYIFCLVLIEACSTSVPSNIRDDEGGPLPIILTHFTAIDTTVVLRGKPPAEPDSNNLDYKFNGTPPTPIVMIAPAYPEVFRRIGIEGTVWIKLLVTSEGDVSKAEIMKSDNEGFNKFALRAAIQWKFTPATEGDSTIACWAAIPLRFKLNK